MKGGESNKSEQKKKKENKQETQQQTPQTPAYHEDPWNCHFSELHASGR